MPTTLGTAGADAKLEWRLILSLVAGYVLALLVVGSIPIAMHFLIGRTATLLAHSAQVINTAGRQRTFAARVTLAAERYSANPSEIHAHELDSEIDDLRQGRALLMGPDGAPAELMSPEVHAVYFEGPDAVDPQVASFLALASRVRAAPGDASALEALDRATQAPLRVGLNRVVGAYQAEQEKAVANLGTNQTRAMFAVLAVLVIEALFIVRPMLILISRYRKRLQLAASQDPLTGLLNRNALLERGGLLLQKSAKQSTPVSVALFEIDDYATLSGDFGDTGANALVRQAAVALSELPRATLTARFGSHSFAALMQKSAPTLADACDNVRTNLLAALPNVGGREIALSCSAGIAERRGEESLDAMLARADAALDDARVAGGNRVQIA